MEEINNLFAAKLREIGEKLIKNSATIVGHDPNTTSVDIRIALFEDDQLQCLGSHNVITRVRSAVDIEINKKLPYGGEE